MGKIAFVFSGQGAQYPGMGKSLYNTSVAAKELYSYADTKRPGTTEQSFEGTPEELRQTSNTQPCLYLVDLCSALALNEHGIYAEGAAGFSLGEIAALAYAGAYSGEAGFDIVCQRGQYMQKAAEKLDTAMSAVINLDSKIIEDICKEISGVYPVNYNSEMQTVIAGTKDAIAEFKNRVQDMSCKIIDLAVGAAFHSPFMDSAAEEFAAVIDKYEFSSLKIPVYANHTGEPYDAVKETLKMQINHPVKWNDTIERMIKDGFDTFIEVGAGKTLSGLIKKISKEVSVYHVEDEETLLLVCEAVKNA